MMTYEQAHKFLEVKQREMTKNRGLYNEIEISINGKAIEAVEKQIPKKPRQINTAAIQRYECPICSHYLISYHEKVGFYQGFQDEYCCRCGQRLDWESK